MGSSTGTTCYKAACDSGYYLDAPNSTYFTSTSKTGTLGLTCYKATGCKDGYAEDGDTSGLGATYHGMKCYEAGCPDGSYYSIIKPTVTHMLFLERLGYENCYFPSCAIGYSSTPNGLPVAEWNGYKCYRTNTYDPCKCADKGLVAVTSPTGKNGCCPTAKWESEKCTICSTVAQYDPCLGTCDPASNIPYFKTIGTSKCCCQSSTSNIASCSCCKGSAYDQVSLTIRYTCGNPGYHLFIYLDDEELWYGYCSGTRSETVTVSPGNHTVKVWVNGYNSENGIGYTACYNSITGGGYSAGLTNETTVNVTGSSATASVMAILPSCSAFPGDSGGGSTIKPNPGDSGLIPAL